MTMYRELYLLSRCKIYLLRITKFGSSEIRSHSQSLRSRRQLHYEFSTAGLRTKSDRPVVLCRHNSFRDVQPQPRAHARWLGCVERLENLVPNLRCNPRTLIGDPYADLSVLRPRANPHFGPIGSRVGCVVEEVGPHLA